MTMHRVSGRGWVVPAGVVAALVTGAAVLLVAIAKRGGEPSAGPTEPAVETRGVDDGASAASREAGVEPGESAPGGVDTPAGIAELISRAPAGRAAEIDGRYVIVLELRDEKGIRATVDFDAPWRGERTFDAHLIDVGDDRRSTMRFKLKTRVEWGNDRTLDAPFGHGDRITLAGRRDGLYLAEDGFRMDRARLTGAKLVLVEAAQR